MSGIFILSTCCCVGMKMVEIEGQRIRNRMWDKKLNLIVYTQDSVDSSVMLSSLTQVIERLRAISRFLVIVVLVGVLGGNNQWKSNWISQCLSVAFGFPVTAVYLNCLNIVLLWLRGWWTEGCNVKCLTSTPGFFLCLYTLLSLYLLNHSLINSLFTLAYPINRSMHSLLTAAPTRFKFIFHSLSPLVTGIHSFTTLQQ